ncbi:hypothetical protein ACROYT_G042587 [Oculina patagonica]
MLYLAVFLFRAVFIYCLACPLVVHAKLFADCTFGDEQSSKSAENMSALSIKLSGQLPFSRNVSHSCLLKTDNQKRLLYLRAKRNEESKEVHAKLFADCTFGDEQSSKSAENMSALSMKLSGQLPFSRNVSHSCLLKTDNQKRLLYLRAKRNEESKEGSLHVSVYGTDEESFQLGHLDISRSTVGWNSLPICPSGSSNEASDKYLTFTGSSGLNFTVEIAQVENIKLDERREFTISPSNSIEVFQFIPTEDISDKQLDVTVISESADVPAYLKVSRVCKDVKDNIDDVDYKGESLRLSFAKKGRITLSKFSVPPLTDSTASWFIGIARKNASGNTSFYATKTVILTLTRSFDYMYPGPLALLFTVSIIVGVAVSFLAWYCFKNPCRRCRCTDGTSDGTDEDERSRLTNNKKEEEERVDWKEFFSAMLNVIKSYSLGWGLKTYSYITLIVGSVLMVGAFQFVFANWYLMIQEGDRDNCYYNDFCYRVSYYDVPYNLMISNVAYVFHGLILAVNVVCIESDLLARCTKLADAAVNDAERINDEYASNQTRPDQNQFSQTGRDQNQSALTRSDQNQTLRPDTEIQFAQTRPEQNQSAQTGRNQNQLPPYKHLPNHILICSDISPHLETMIVPQHTIDKDKAQKLFAEARKKRFTFTIGYAFAWALIFEGFFSSLYHLCPRVFY